MVDTIKNGSDTKVINIIYDIHKNNISNLQILSEKRDMVSELFDTAVNNARPIYKIIYEYTFLYTPPKKSRFTKQPESIVLKRTVKDPAIFYYKEDAEYYLENATMPARMQYYNSSGYFIRAYIFLKDVTPKLKILGLDSMEICITEDGTILYGIYGTNKFDCSVLLDSIRKIKNLNNFLFTGEAQVVKTININNNIIDYTESAELDDLKNKRNYIIVEEIKRLTKHIKFLEKLIK